MRHLLTLVAVLVSIVGIASTVAAQGATPVASPASGCVETSEDENEATVMR